MKVIFTARIQKAQKEKCPRLGAPGMLVNFKSWLAAATTVVSRSRVNRCALHRPALHWRCRWPAHRLWLWLRPVYLLRLLLRARYLRLWPWGRLCLLRACHLRFALLHRVYRLRLVPVHIPAIAARIIILHRSRLHITTMHFILEL